MNTNKMTYTAKDQRCTPGEAPTVYGIAGIVVVPVAGVVVPVAGVVVPVAGAVVLVTPTGGVAENVEDGVDEAVIDDVVVVVGCVFCWCKVVVVVEEVVVVVEDLVVLLVVVVDGCVVVVVLVVVVIVEDIAEVVVETAVLAAKPVLVVFHFIKRLFISYLLRNFLCKFNLSVPSKTAIDFL